MIQTISKSWSIRWKLTHIAMTTTTFALLLTIFGLAIFEYFSLRQHIKGELQMLGQIVGGNSTAAIAFNRPDDATATLATLEAHQGIRAACIYDADGKILATYQAREEVGVIFEPHPRPPGLYFSARYLDIYQPVQLDGKTIGTVFLHSDLGQLNERIMLYAWVSPLILVAASGFGLLLVNQLQRQVSAPITSLAQTSRRISQENNYTLRASKFSDDELGQLADAFNHMVEGIRRRDEQIQSHLEDVKAARDQLEARVEARTADLKLANAELQAQMEHRREAERKRAEMQSNLVEASRRAGMADVATGVLHNVGNVLNSVNVSTQIVHDTVKASRVSTLVKAAELLQEHGADLPGFFAADARARALPEFFSKLSQALAREQATLLNEVDGLASNIAHIREIVAMQQSLSRVSGVHSAVTLGELIED
ncbi:MAG TPA: CHASE sensor domain-containing protein, partial [Phycisphaerae bacterium]|nr:CHASE sensor domain-containing protein [Phycisphaerae bacterium]